MLNKIFLYSLVILFGSFNSFKEKKNKQKEGILIYKFVAGGDKILYFTEDTSFLNLKPSKKIRLVKLTAIPQMQDEYYPYSFDSLTYGADTLNKNFDYFKEFRYYQGYNDTARQEIAFYAKVRIKFKYQEKLYHQRISEWEVYYNKSNYNFRICYIGDPNFLQYIK